MEAATEFDPQQVYDDFWKEIVERDGVLDVEQVKKELADYKMLLEFVPKVYYHVTAGRISKPNTLPSVVIAIADDVVNETVEAAMKEMDNA